MIERLEDALAFMVGQSEYTPPTNPRHISSRYPWKIHGLIVGTTAYLSLLSVDAHEHVGRFIGYDENSIPPEELLELITYAGGTGAIAIGTMVIADVAMRAIEG